MAAKCESKIDTIQHSTEPEMFRTEKIWGGRKRIEIECLTHAAASEQRGQKTDLILQD